jgi:hypothetical protein
MTITFENDNNIIVYTLEKVIVYARRTQQIFVARCVWWLALIIGLDQGLVNYIDIIQSRVAVTVTSEETPVVVEASDGESIEGQQDQILQECEAYLQHSRRLQEIHQLKNSGSSKSGRINPLKATKKSLKNKFKKTQGSKEKPVTSRTEGIEPKELARRKAAGECLRCAWPADRKEAHRIKDCRRPSKPEEGTASYPKGKAYERAKIPEETSEPDTGSSSEGEEESTKINSKE